jgi:tetratricopeptide (TPR) repeat protein
MHHALSRFLLALLCVPGFQALADSLDNLPAQWQQQLNQVAPIDIATLQADEQKAISETRSRIEDILQSQTPETRQLASEYGNLGNLYLTHGLYTTADACYSNAIRLAPDAFPWAYYSAYLAQENGNMDQALTRYMQASKLDPNYPPARYRLAQVYADLNREDEAYAMYNSLINEPGFEAAAHNGVGQVFMMKHDYSDAIEHFNRALELAPEATQIHYPLALALRATGETQLAKQHLQKYGKQPVVINDPLVDALEALKDPASRHFVAAMTAVLKKDFGKAVTEFESGLQYQPDNTAARTSYARVLYLHGNKDKARSQLEQVVQQDPGKTLALFLLAMLDDETNQREQAAKLYHRVIQLSPHHEGAHFFLGNYYLHARDYINALAHYDRVIQQDDKNIPAHIFKLVAMMGNGSPDSELLAASRHITARVPGLIHIKRIEVLLLALSDDAGVRNSNLALELAEQMYQAGQYPVNMELLALATASSGNFARASEQMQKAISAEQQHDSSANLDRMNASLQLLQNNRLPGLHWQDEIRHMLPPPTRALATFRDYPDPNPI